MIKRKVATTKNNITKIIQLTILFYIIIVLFIVCIVLFNTKRLKQNTAHNNESKIKLTRPKRKQHKNHRAAYTRCTQ